MVLVITSGARHSGTLYRKWSCMCENLLHGYDCYMYMTLHMPHRQFTCLHCSVNGRLIQFYFLQIFVMASSTASDKVDFYTTI